MPAEDPTLGIATWCRTERPLAAWVHRPADGRARGAVVIAPPMGRERTVAYRSVRRLAIELARSGRVVVRFTWSGQGESAPLRPGDDPRGSWRADLEAAIELASRASGIPRVNGVGLRVGAALLAEQDDRRLGMRILWEPVSGASFLRWQSRMRLLANPDIPLRGDVVETIGEQFDPAVAGALSSVAMPRGDSPLSPVVMETADDAAMLYQASPELAGVPLGSIERIVALLPDDGRSVSVPDWSPVREATIELPGAAPIRESLVEVGASRLPGVLSAPIGTPERGEAACVLAPGNEPKGSTTLWTHVARRAAAAGVPALRFDRRTSGDAEPAELLAGLTPYTAESVDDVAAGVLWLRERYRGEVTGVGLCAAAWLFAASAQRSGLARVLGYAMNRWQTTVYELPGAAPAPAAGGAAEQPAAPEPTGLRSRLRRRVNAILRGRASAHKPFWIRYALARLGLMDSVHLFLPTVARGTALEFYFSSPDFARFRRLAGPESARRLVRRGRAVRYRELPDLDHGAQTASGEARVIETVEAVFGVGREHLLPLGLVNVPQ